MTGEGATGADEVHSAERVHRGGRDQPHGVRGRHGRVLVHLHARGIHTGIIQKYAWLEQYVVLCDLSQPRRNG